MSKHVAAEVLAAYVDGKLENGQKPGVEAHLSRCLECREALVAVCGIQHSREKIPVEFLRLALGDRQRPVRAGMPARQVFGIAAVFLVVVLIGYFFIPQRGVKTARIAEKEIPQPTVVVEEHLLPAKTDRSGSARREALERAVPAREIPAAAVNEAKIENKLATREAPPGQPAAPRPVKKVEPAALPLKEARLRMADEVGKPQPQGVDGGAVGGVRGGLETLEEKDKERMNQPAAAAAPARAKGTADEMAQALPAEALPLRPVVRIEGDVAFSDLLDPGVPDSWDWFPEDKAMELTIDAAGAVKAVRLLGQWDGLEATRASESAGKLTFRPSARKTRRAVLSRPPLN